jgi:dethiobiotin synthetase
MTHSYFIAGTDTGIGKTVVACALLQVANNSGYQTIGVKPVAAGCEQIDGQWCNEDALLLQQYASVELAYGEVNPVALTDAIAPHIAAENQRVSIGVSDLAMHCEKIAAKKPDLLVIEGAGGWRVPLNERETLADLVIALQVPVILVVGMRLGCLNHAMLTVEAIKADGLVLAGWVANRVDPQMPCCQENVDTLKRLIGAPCLGELPYIAGAKPGGLASHLRLDSLFS